MDRRHIVLVAFMLLVAVAVRLPPIGQSLWGDEIYSVTFAGHPIDGFFANLAENDTHPPLYYLILRAWMWVSTSEIWLRLLSVIAGLGVVAFACAAAWTIGGPEAGLIAGFFAALTPQLVELSLEVRNYMLMTLFAAGATYLLARIIARSGGRWWEWLLVGALQGLAMLTFYYAAFFILGVNVVLLVEALRTRGRAIPFGRLVVSWVVAALVFAPWVPLFLRQASHVGASGEGTSLAEVPSGMVLSLVRLGPFHALHIALEWINAPHATALAAVATALLILAALRRPVAERDAMRLRWIGLLLGGIVSVVVLAPLVSWARDFFFSGRYLAYGSFLACLLAVEALRSVLRRPQWRSVAAGAACVVLLAGLPSIAYRVNEPWRDAAKFVDARIRPGDLVIGVEADPQNYAWYGRVPADLRRLPVDVPGAPVRPPGDWLMALTEEDVPHLRRLFSRYDRVAAVWSHTHRRGHDRNVALADRVLHEMGFERVAEQTFPGRADIHVKVFERPAAAR